MNIMEIKIDIPDKEYEEISIEAARMNKDINELIVTGIKMFLVENKLRKYKSIEDFRKNLCRCGTKIRKKKMNYKGESIN
jgi:hypothetical protein